MYGEQRLLVWLSIVSLLIVTSIWFLVPESTSQTNNSHNTHSRIKRRVGYYQPRGAKDKMKEVQNPCDKPQATTKEMYFCYGPHTQETLLSFPLGYVPLGGYWATEWLGYTWYIDTTGYNTAGGWGKVSHEIKPLTGFSSWPRSSYGWDSGARLWQKRLLVVKVVRINGASTLQLWTNFTEHPLLESPNQKHPTPFTKHSHCYTLGLCVDRIGKDVCTRMHFCPNRPAFNQFREQPPDVTQSTNHISDGNLLSLGPASNPGF